jgi:hypothetical protein
MITQEPAGCWLEQQVRHTQNLERSVDDANGKMFRGESSLGAGCLLRPGGAGQRR